MYIVNVIRVTISYSYYVIHTRLATNMILATNENIGVSVVTTDMRAYVDLGKYWPEGLSINAAFEDLLIKGMKIDKRTLVAAKQGTLARSEYLTLIRLRDWARELSDNKKLTIDEILVLKDEEEDSS